MSRRNERSGFAARPRDPDGWVQAPERAASRPTGAGIYTARLTVDITPALRGRIKVAAFQRGMTAAELLRDLLDRAFPLPDGEGP